MYVDERREKWARALYENASKYLSTPPSWPEVKNSPIGAIYFNLADAALKLHLECCEHDCRKCGSRLTHSCTRCERI